jgi:hypothetical protein
VERVERAALRRANPARVLACAAAQIPAELDDATDRLVAFGMEHAERMFEMVTEEWPAFAAYQERLFAATETFPPEGAGVDDARWLGSDLPLPDRDAVTEAQAVLRRVAPEAPVDRAMHDALRWSALLTVGLDTCRHQL